MNNADNNKPFLNAMKNKAARKGFDPRVAAHANNARRNARQMPTRQFNRGR
ncbi:hypothetical protein ACFVH6_11685 [Spirillospora sp. NPDC127200]